MAIRLWQSYRHILVSSFRAGRAVGDRMGGALAERTTDPELKAARALRKAHSNIWQVAGAADAAAAAGRFDVARALYARASSRAGALSVDAPAESDLHSALTLVKGVAAWGLWGGRANVERAAGNGSLALEHLQGAATAIREVLPGSVFEAVALNRIGVAYFEIGAIETAVDAHEEALRILDHPAATPKSPWTPPRPAESYALRSLILSCLGNAYAVAGNHERAEELASAALAELPPEAVGHPVQASCLGSAATTLLWIGDVEGAVEQLETALAIDRQSADPRDLLVTLTNLGRARLELGDALTARRHLEEAVRIVRTRHFRGALAVTAMNNLAMALFRSGLPDSATALLQEAADAGDGTAPQPPELAWVRANLAVHLLDRGHVDDAVRQAEYGIRVAEAIRARVGTPSSREQLSERLQLPYQALILALHARGDRTSHARAFSVAEMSRARGLTDTFSMLHGVEPGLRSVTEQERRLRRRHSRVRRELHRAGEPGDRISVLDPLANEERELAWMIESATRQRSERDRPTPAPPTIEAVQAQLGATTLLLSFEVNARGAFVWSVRAHDAVLVRLTDDPGELLTLVAVAVNNSWSDEDFTDEHRAAHRELGRLLLSALPSHHLGDAAHIVVVSGMLGSLPLELLPVDLVPLAPGILLVDLAPTSYLPSATTLLALRNASARRSVVPAHEFLAVVPGNADRPTPAAGREARAAAATFKRSTILTSPAATEPAVLATIEEFRYLHFACHGHLDGVQPLESGLWLDPPSPDEVAADEDTGDILHLHSVLDLQLAADVVVCSACATGAGRLREGEGVIGFATAFLAAGARSLVLTLWPVVDRPTMRLMTAFYAAMADGWPPVTALWHAKRGVRASHPHVYADPRHWAAFVAVGLPDDHVGVATGRRASPGEAGATTTGTHRASP